MADVKVRIELNKNNFKDFDKYNGLKQIESLSQSSPDAGSIFYDTLESSGSVKIVDEQGQIYKMISEGEMENSNSNISLFANGNIVQTHRGKDSSYSLNEKVLTIDLGNRLEDLDVLIYKGYPYPNKAESLSTLLFDVLSNLKTALFGKELTLDEFKTMLSSKYDNGTTLYSFLEDTIIDYPYIEANQTYRSVIRQFCLIAQMQMYIDDNNNIKFVSARPKAFNGFDNAIYIPKKNMFSALDHNIFLKNKYDGVAIEKSQVIDEYVGNTAIYSSDTIDLSELTLDDFPYIRDDELYTQTQDENSSINYRFEYGTRVLNYTGSEQYAKYIMSKYYYKDFTFSVPKKSSDNLQQNNEVKNYLISDNSKSYSLIYEKTIGTCRGAYDTSANRFVSLNRKFTVTPEDKTYRVVEGNGALDGSITATVNNETIELPDDDNSRIVQIIGSYPDHYVVKVKVLVSLEKINIWYLNPATISSSGTFEKYMPKSLTVSIYGSQRTIKFENVDASTTNIEDSKTPISLDTSKFLQKDSVVNDIKFNILGDYVNGVSNGTVTVSCNDYYNAKGDKIIDWNKGELIKVNDLLYFDNDKYFNGNQRHWKVKGRTFRKEGVPMLDLELEEVSYKPLESYSWEEINELSQNGLAKSKFSVGESKKITLSNGEVVTATIVGFNHDTLASGDGIAGITFAVTDYNHKSAWDGLWWYDSIIRTTALPSIYNSMPSNVKSYIKPVKKLSVVGYDIEPFRISETTDTLWLFSSQEVAGSWDDGKEYKYMLRNLKDLIPEEQDDWWLRSKPYFQGNNQYTYIKNYELKWTTRRYEEKNIVFGFCI